MYRIAATPRPRWEQVPGPVRQRISALAGSAVRSATTVSGGFSNGFAGAVALQNGRSVFVKALAESTNPAGAQLYRDEARVLQRMPRDAPVPGLLEWFDDADTFDRWSRVDAGDPGLGSYDPWLLAHRDRLVATASGWSAAIDGSALNHGDLRPDNIVVSDRNAWAVDWPSASVGAPWVDALLMLPALAMLDAGPAPSDVVDSHPLLTGVDPAVIDAALSAALGYFVTSSLLDPPPGLPTVRAFQRAQATVIVRWLRDRWT